MYINSSRKFCSFLNTGILSRIENPRERSIKRPSCKLRSINNPNRFEELNIEDAINKSPYGMGIVKVVCALLASMEGRSPESCLTGTLYTKQKSRFKK